MRLLLPMLLLAAAPLHAQDAPDTARAETGPPYFAAAAGGTAGVSAGWLAGGAAGLLLADCDDVPSDAHFCGAGEFLIGGLIGGTVGAAAGAYLASRLAGARPQPAAALAGAVLGIGAGYLAGRGAAELGLGPVPVIISAGIGQGAFTGLFTLSGMRKR